MMGKAAEFRGMQREAIDDIVYDKSHVVAVMLTGAGKGVLLCRQHVPRRAVRRCSWCR